MEEANKQLNSIYHSSSNHACVLFQKQNERGHGLD